MNVPFLDLRRRIEALRPELEAALGAVLDSGRLIGGAPVEEFEQAWATACGAAHAVGVASGTDAITLALRAAGVAPGDEVVTAANTCIPTVAAIERAGATPVLADVDAQTLTLDPVSAAAAVTVRTRAIVPVHLYGRPADLEALVRIGPLVVEDAAQAHGATFSSIRGVAAAYSFYPTKNLGALGDGGAVVTDDQELAARGRRLREYGEEARYRSVEPGFNSRLDTLQAAFLLRALPHLEAWNARRRELAAYYRERLAGVVELPPDDPGHAWHTFVVRVPDRDAFRAWLSEQGVETLVHYPLPVHGHPAYAHLARPGLEQAERAAREVVSLPLSPELTDAEAEAVVAAIVGRAPYTGQA